MKATKDTRKKSAERSEPDKKPWVKPVVRASGEFDKAALACARGATAFPSCSLQPS